MPLDVTECLQTLPDGSYRAKSPPVKNHCLRRMSEKLISSSEETVI